MGCCVVICLERSENDSHFAYGLVGATATPSSLASLSSEWFAFLVLVYPDCPGKNVINFKTRV